MAITYYMLQIPAYLFFVLIVIFGAFVGALITFIFRKHVKLKILRSHNEVTGFLFLAIAGLYSLLLSFVVFLVWDQLNDARNNASIEGSTAQALYRDMRYYPDSSQTKELRKIYGNFVRNVIYDEFPAMSELRPSRKTPESFNQVYYEMEKLKPNSAIQVQLVANMFDHLNELARSRGLRVNSTHSEIPASIWLPIILGALITMFCAALLDVEHHFLHILLSTFLGMFIAMLFYMIIVLDHPYTGTHRIKPGAYKHILLLESWEKDVKPVQQDSVLKDFPLY